MSAGYIKVYQGKARLGFSFGNEVASGAILYFLDKARRELAGHGVTLSWESETPEWRFFSVNLKGVNAESHLTGRLIKTFNAPAIYFDVADCRRMMAVLGEEDLELMAGGVQSELTLRLQQAPPSTTIAARLSS
jgi:hypothetical protein